MNSIIKYFGLIILMGSILYADNKFVRQDIIRQEKEETGIEPVKLSGFRIGVSWLVPKGSSQEYLKKVINDDNINPMLSLFGWQHEVRYFSGNNLTGVVEFIGLLGGFNQGLIIPSLTMPIGIRTASGYEIGAGPHLSMKGNDNGSMFTMGFVVAGGVTFKVDQLNIPINFVLTSGRPDNDSEQGYILSFLTGYAF